MTQCNRCLSVVETLGKALLQKPLEPSLGDSLKTVLKELGAETIVLEDQVKKGDAETLLLKLDSLLISEENTEEIEELDKLLQSFAFFSSEEAQKTHFSSPSDARSSFTRSTISTPMFQETFLEQEGKIMKSNKKTQSEIQLINYDTSSKGMFWIEDTLDPKDRFFLEKVGTHNRDKGADCAHSSLLQNTYQRKINR